MIKPTRCPTCGRKTRRTTQANARYWVLLHAISEGIKPEGNTFSSESWHTYFKSKYLGCEETKLPNGKVFQIPQSTADLEKEEFTDYMTQVESWANERGVFLEMETL